MRRIRILLYWLFKKKNNVTFLELLAFCFKPQVRGVANRYLKEIVKQDSSYKITFNTISNPLYWPIENGPDGIYQVTAETFDSQDWHYYQKKHTVVEQNEVLLDIGAAEGLFALSVVEHCKKIFLVEPSDYFVRTLRETFKNNSNKVTIFDVAIGSQEGEILFDNNSLNGRITQGDTLGKKKRMTTIDALLSSTRITYLKADIEGFEMEMLKGAEKVIKDNRPKIAITSYHTENNASEIIDLILKFVPEYKFYTKGIVHTDGKPVMIHFWI